MSPIFTLYFAFELNLRIYMSNPTVPLEWLYETLIKRCSEPFNLKLNELFLLVPSGAGEAEFDYELVPNSYYPLVPKGKIKVFFLNPSKLIATRGNAARLNKEVKGLDLATPRVLCTRYFKYPKVSKVKSSKTLVALNKAFSARFN